MSLPLGTIVTFSVIDSPMLVVDTDIDTGGIVASYREPDGAVIETGWVPSISVAVISYPAGQAPR